MPQIWWVTSFPERLAEVSGLPFVRSFIRRNVPGRLLVATEGKIDVPEHPTVQRYDLDQDEFLQKWLAQEADHIPKDLGGRADGACRCPGGPFDAHDKNRHRMPCIAHWFNRHSSRWFRKTAALRVAGELAHEAGIEPPILIWVDADCRFRRRPTEDAVQKWFGQAAVFYHKSTRPVLEAGVVGYWLGRGADKVLGWMIETYWSGAYRGLVRWDDCYMLQKAMQKNPQIPTVDLAQKVGSHANVIPYGPVGQFIEHDKGRHSRKTGIIQ